MLERRGRAINVWKESIESALRSPTVYRLATPTRDQLEQVVEDAKAPAERRVGAALALASLPGSPVERVRVAAEATADDRIRKALLDAAEGTLDEDAVAAASKQSRTG